MTTTTDIKNILRARYKTSLFDTSKLLLGYDEITERTHGPIIKILESPSKRKLICVPRGCFKSSIASISYPIWRLINNPNERILIDSELFNNSKNFLREIKGHLDSDRVTSLFGKFKSDTWNEAEIIVRQRSKNQKEPSIMAGGVETEKTGMHVDLIIMDDLNGSQNSGTPEACQKIIDHIRYNMAILEPHGTMILVGTRYNAMDAIGWVLDQVNEPQDVSPKGLLL